MPRHSETQQIKIPFLISEPAANTYGQTEVIMPVEPASNLVFDLDRIEFDLSPPGMAANTLGNTTVQFTRSTQTSIIDTINADIIAKINRRSVNNSANAAFYTFYVDENVLIETERLANYIVNRSIFVGILSSSQAANKTIRGYLVGRLVRVTQQELTSLMLDQLT